MKTLQQLATIALLFCICSTSSAWSRDILASPLLETCSDGSKVVVWETDSDSGPYIEASVYDPINGLWSTPTTLSTPGETSSNPLLAMNSLGNAVVAWYALDSAAGTYLLKATTRMAGGSWDAPYTLSPTTNQISGLSVKTDSSGSTGSATILWSCFCIMTSTNSLWAATTPFGGSWNTPVQIR